jgi:hypothetical protein
MAFYTDIIIDQGSAFNATIPVLALNNFPLDLTLYSGRGQIRRNYSASTAVNFTVEILEPETSGQVRISLTPTQTADMKAGRYVFDIEVYTENDNDVIRVIEGQVTINPRVTGSTSLGPDCCTDGSSCTVYNTIISGTVTPPPNTLGNNGDYYIDKINYVLYGPKSVGVWPVGVNLIGADGEPGPAGEVTVESLNQLLDDLGLGPTDIVPVVGLQLSDTGDVVLDNGTLGLNSSGELILHNGLENGDGLPAIKAGGSLTQATSFVSATDIYIANGEYPFKIAEFNIPFNQVSTVGDLLNLNGKISLKFDLINPYQNFVLPDGGIYLVVALDDSVLVSPGTQPYAALYYPYFNKHQSNDGNSTFKIESDININIQNVGSLAEEISLQTRFAGGIKNTIFKNTQGTAPIVATTYHDEWLDAASLGGYLMEFQQSIPRPVNENAFIKIPIYIVGVDYSGNPARPMYCSSVLNLSKTSKYQTP